MKNLSSDFIINVLLILYLILFMILLITIFPTSAYAYTTEQNLLLNKISLNNNLSIPEQVTLFDLLQKQDNSIYNDSSLVYDIQDKINLRIDNLNKSFEDYKKLIDLNLISINNSIKNLNPTVDKLAVLDKQKELLEIAYQNQQTTEEDPFDKLLKQITDPNSNNNNNNNQNYNNYTNINFNNYVTKTQLDNQIKTLKQDNADKLKSLDDKISSSINIQQIDTSQFITKDILAFIFILFSVGLFFGYSKYIAPEINKNKIFFQRVQELEKKLEKKQEEIKI